jgi:prophage antirepressor-like protein
MTATESNIIPFGFEDHLVRVYKPNGEPWFVGKDVCSVLEIKDHKQALSRLDPDEREGVLCTTPSGEQTMIVVSEAGVFRMIFSSRKPEAERFKRWLAHEVLPALRKHGKFELSARSDAGEAQPLSEFPAGDEALSLHLAKLATLKECRMIHGPRAAARLWRRLGMPQVQESVIAEADEGRGCLAALLAEQVAGNGMDFSIRELIDDALEENPVAQLTLRRYGVAAVTGSEEGIMVANIHKEIANTFAGTPWADGRWRAALMRLPGAIPSRRTLFEGRQTRCVFIPSSVIDTIPTPVETGGNVVPLHS